VTVALTEVEIERLAGAGSKLRPEWTARSLKTWITENLADRPFADAAIALAAVCVDPAVRTPAVLLGAGHWWVAAQASFQALRSGVTTYAPAGGGRPEVPHVGPRPGSERCGKPGHEHEEGRVCRLCRGEELDGGTSPALERDWDPFLETKPVHALLGVSASAVVCGLPRREGRIWMALGTDPALLVRRTTCAGCRRELARMVTEASAVRGAGAAVDVEAGQ
jgi:hypothetical protein